MAYDNLGFTKSIKSTNNLFTSRQQYYFVSIDSSGQAIVCSHTGSYAIGVVQDTPSAGDPAQICGPGAITKVYCAGTITPGQFVMTNGSGQALAATSSSHILGVALTAGANGYLCDILFQPMGTI